MRSLTIILGVASAGSPTQPFLDSLAKLKLPESVAQLERSVVIGNYIPAQRDVIMTDALSGNFDYLFFVDDDIILPADALASLIAVAEADPQTAVVGGLYYSRDSVRPIAVADWNSTDTSTAHIPPFSTTSTDIVDGIGFGCALLRIDAARRLTAPYFPAHVYIETAARRVRQCDEDYLYCERVRQAGFNVRLDARVRCEHYDRGSDSISPVRWEADADTDFARMIVMENGTTKLVALNEDVPRIVERHSAATLTYISVD